MASRSDVLLANIARITSARRIKRTGPALQKDQILQELVATMIAARMRAGLTQAEVAE